MANICGLEINIKGLNLKELLETLTEIFECPEIDQGPEEDKRCLGTARYFFDVEIVPVQILPNSITEIFMYANVKWSLMEDDFISYIDTLKKLKGMGTLREVTIQYEECGCEVYGRYTYTNANGVETYSDRYMPAASFPEYLEEYYDMPDGDEVFQKQLEQTLEHKGITEILKENENG